MKARQLRVELKSIKKGNCLVTGFVLGVKFSANPLLVLVDVVSKKDQVDSILVGVRDNLAQNRGRGCMYRGHGSGRECLSPRTRPTYQICGKFGHTLINCWHRFDESLTPRQAKLP